MLAKSRIYIADPWWLVAFPGLVIMITILSINLLGDGLRDALDPRLRNVISQRKGKVKIYESTVTWVGIAGKGCGP